MKTKVCNQLFKSDHIDTVASFSDILTELIQGTQLSSANHALATGLVDLDRKLLGGFRKSSVAVVAGRPLMGTTAFATGVAFNNARIWQETSGKDGAGVLFFSLENSAKKLMSRILATLTSVTPDRLLHGELQESDLAKIEEVNQRLSAVPFYIDDTAALSIGEICSQVHCMKSKTPQIGLIVIDYLQLIRSSDDRLGKSRAEEVAEIIYRLKSLAVELDVSVLLLSHISRAVEQYDDKRPKLADLRNEYPLVERNADVIMFLFREIYYLEQSQPERRPRETVKRFERRYGDWLGALGEAYQSAECIVARNNHGPIGTVRLSFDNELALFNNLVSK